MKTGVLIVLVITMRLILSCSPFAASSTSQVAYWLTQHDTKVMLAACDTFRAGAVEQLRTHGRRLQVCTDNPCSPLHS